MNVAVLEKAACTAGTAGKTPHPTSLIVQPSSTVCNMRSDRCQKCRWHMIQHMMQYRMQHTSRRNMQSNPTPKSKAAHMM
jgi:hypothetical protein